MLVLFNNLFGKFVSGLYENNLEIKDTGVDKLATLSIPVLNSQNGMARSDNHERSPKRKTEKRSREEDGETESNVIKRLRSARFGYGKTEHIQSFHSSKTIVSTGVIEKRNGNFYDAAIQGSIFTKDQETQKLFFRDHDISEWFRLEVDENRKVKFKIPKEYQKLLGLIYVIRNRIKKRYLIGETWQCLSKRLSGYSFEINTPGSEKRVKKEGRIDFLTDVKKNPQDFEVGILYKLSEKIEDDEDIKECEMRFIQGKSAVWDLYNDHQGGGGGVALSFENPIAFAVPNNQNFTPEKYYPMRANEQGKMRFHFSPGFNDRIMQISQDVGSTQTFAYSIKNLDTGERYIGVTGDPQARAYRHAFLAEYADPYNEKYDPDRLSGHLHFEIANNPANFAFGLFPLKSSETVLSDDAIDQEALNHYSFPEGRALLEKLLIAIKQSLHSESGFNANRGGGGGIANPHQKARVRKKLNFL